MHPACTCHTCTMYARIMLYLEKCHAICQGRRVFASCHSRKGLNAVGVRIVPRAGMRGGRDACTKSTFRINRHADTNVVSFFSSRMSHRLGHFSRWRLSACRKDGVPPGDCRRPRETQDSIVSSFHRVNLIDKNPSSSELGIQSDHLSCLTPNSDRAQNDSRNPISRSSNVQDLLIDNKYTYIKFHDDLGSCKM